MYDFYFDFEISNWYFRENYFFYYIYLLFEFDLFFMCGGK